MKKRGPVGLLGYLKINDDSTPRLLMQPHALCFPTCRTFVHDGDVKLTRDRGATPDEKHRMVVASNEICTGWRCMGFVERQQESLPKIATPRELSRLNPRSLPVYLREICRMNLELSPLEVQTRQLWVRFNSFPIWWGYGLDRMVSRHFFRIFIQTNIWPIYNDLSRGHPKWWFSKGIPPKIALN